MTALMMRTSMTQVKRVVDTSNESYPGNNDDNEAYIMALMLMMFTLAMMTLRMIIIILEILALRLIMMTLRLILIMLAMMTLRLMMMMMLIIVAMIIIP